MSGYGNAKYVYKTVVSGGYSISSSRVNSSSERFYTNGNISRGVYQTFSKK